MRALVVHDSDPGHPGAFAREVARGLASEGVVAEVVSAESATRARVLHADLVVVGGPIHRRSLRRHLPSRPTSATFPPRGEHGIGPCLAKWLRDLQIPTGTLVAAYDTRDHPPKFLAGTAARAMRRNLVERGCIALASPKGFVTAHAQDRLTAATQQSARRWGARLGRRLHNELEPESAEPRSTNKPKPSANQEAS